jgi:predicted glycogen debranching enzyme
MSSAAKNTAADRPLQGDVLERRAEVAQQRFEEQFWNQAGGCLYDCVDWETRDASLRPNQLFALSLPFPLLSRERALAVLAAVEDVVLGENARRAAPPRRARAGSAP